MEQNNVVRMFEQAFAQRLPYASFSRYGRLAFWWCCLRLFPACLQQKGIILFMIFTVHSPMFLCYNKKIFDRSLCGSGKIKGKTKGGPAHVGI